MPKLPIALKLSYTAFMVVMVPTYLHIYGWTNFLFFCDTCLVLGFIAVWTESALLASVPAAGIILPQILWTADFIAEALGYRQFGLTSYMFDGNGSPFVLFLHGLSLYHIWLPFVLAYMVWKVGYDRRAFFGWTPIAWALLFYCYFTTSPPPAPAGSNIPVNIDFIYGFGSAGPQTFTSLHIWFAGLMIGVPLVACLPTALALRWFFPQAGKNATSAR